MVVGGNLLMVVGRNLPMVVGGNCWWLWEGIF